MRVVPGCLAGRDVVRLLLLVVLSISSGCYRFGRLPKGVEQRPLDLQVGKLLQHYTLLSPSPPLPQPIRRPAVVVLHSGFDGDESSAAELGRRLALKGVTVVLPAYRGEVRKLDGKRSEGEIEFCHGEVHDALAAVAWLRQQPGIDPHRVGAIGASHGGCIALVLGERDPQLRALVTLSAPVAAEPLLRYLQERPAETFFYNGILGEQLTSYIKGSPDEAPQAYLDRSPLFQVERLKMPILIIHGTADSIVPVAQACLLAQTLRATGRAVSVTTLDSAGRETEDVVSPCTPPLPTSSRPSAGTTPKTAPRTELLFLEQQNHIYGTKPRKAAHERALQFLLTELAEPTPQRPLQ